MRQLEQTLGYRFSDEALLRQALTHPSMGEGDNQRLEFLGDAVLELYMSELLYEEYPQEQEGALTARRAALVCEKTLSQLARELGLGEKLILSRGEEQTGGRERASTLCDAMEAVVAAVYLDGGGDAARALVKRLFKNEGELLKARGRDDKGLLQAFTQGCGLALPVYEIISESGPAHQKAFVSRVSIAGVCHGTGEDATKKAAEQAAARAALEACRKGETPCG